MCAADPHRGWDSGALAQKEKRKLRCRMAFAFPSVAALAVNTAGRRPFFREGEAGRYNEGAKDKARRMR